MTDGAHVDDSDRLGPDGAPVADPDTGVGVDPDLAGVETDESVEPTTLERDPDTGVPLP